MLWVKAFHIIFMVTWFAGLFYLPRLYVYHAMSTDAVSIERFKIMERKLYWGIMTPGAVLTVIFGVWLLILLGPAWLRVSGWIHLKLTLVGVLIAYHVYLGIVLKSFARNTNVHGHVFFRWINEFPVLILIAVVLLAILKPAF